MILRTCDSYLGAYLWNMCTTLCRKPSSVNGFTSLSRAACPDNPIFLLNTMWRTEALTQRLLWASLAMKYRSEPGSMLQLQPRWSSLLRPWEDLPAVWAASWLTFCKTESLKMVLLSLPHNFVNAFTEQISKECCQDTTFVIIKIYFLITSLVFFWHFNILRAFSIPGIVFVERWGHPRKGTSEKLPGFPHVKSGLCHISRDAGRKATLSFNSLSLS